MRNALLAVAAVLVVFLGGWLIDDKITGSAIPRNQTIDGIDIGRLGEDEARERLGGSALTGQTIRLVHEGRELVATANELGVVAEVDDALAAAADRPALPFQPLAWVRSLFTGDDHVPTFAIDSATLGTFLATEGGTFFELDFGLPQIELVDGEFLEIDGVSTPVVDLDALEARILEAVVSPDDTPTVDIPIGGSEEVDRGAEELIAEAEALTANGISVRVTGGIFQRRISQAAMRTWIVFGGTPGDPTISLDDDLVQSTIETLFIDYGEAGEEPTFEVGPLGEVRIVGSSPGAVCCDRDTAERIWDAMQNGDRVVELAPHEDPDVRGVAWAESLGIVELVGEFTTEYQPNQSRVVNIQRIAELTQGAVIEPGGEFSINDYVGVRTRANGFVDAGVIVNGVFNTSVGGGISQYATTLFNAAFFAGLDFGEYQSHSIYISRYPYGREATVSHPHPDLEIVNNTPYGVLIWPTSDDTSITVRLYSTMWVEGEQTGQSERREGVACTRVTTERTRTWIEDGRTEVDTVTARYRPEGLRCDGSDSDPQPTIPPTVPPTVPPSTTVP